MKLISSQTKTNRKYLIFNGQGKEHKPELLLALQKSTYNI